MKQPECYQKLLAKFINHAEDSEKTKDQSLYCSDNLLSDAVKYTKEELKPGFKYQEELSKQLSYDYLVYQKHSLKTYYFDGKSWDENEKEIITDFIPDKCTKKGKRKQWEGKGHGIREISQTPEGRTEKILLCGKASSITINGRAYYKKYHINDYSAWTEDWENLRANGFEFNFFKNLNAKYMILQKDSTSIQSHQGSLDDLIKEVIKIKGIETLSNQKEDELFDFINDPSKDFNENNDLWKSYTARVFKYGFSPASKTIKNKNGELECSRVPTNIYLHQILSDIDTGLDTKIGGAGFYGKYEEIKPRPNRNIYLGNIFCFLSARNHASSEVPDNGIKYSLDNFIWPLIQIIKPKFLILCGNDATNVISKKLKENNNFSHAFDKYLSTGITKLSEDIHERIERAREKDNLSNDIGEIQFSSKHFCLVLPVRHTSRIQYINDKDEKSERYYVWSQIKKLQKLYFNE